MLEAMPTKHNDNPPFAGFTSPNYTQVPDELFDVLLPTLADNELRVLLYIIRRTFGFKRDADSISLSQMVSGIKTREGQVLDSGTGLAKSTVARGLKSLREKGIIVATRNASPERGDQPTTYRLRFVTDATPDRPAKDPVSRQQDTPRVSLTGQAVSQTRDTQETDPQHTAFEYSIGDALEGIEDTGDYDKPDQTASAVERSGPALADSSLASM